MIALPRPAICLVTSRRLLAPGARTVAEEIAALEAWLAEAIEAGIDLIQIRERDLDAAALKALTMAVAHRAEGTSTRVIVNDRADVAIAAGADGVHLRADGPPVAAVRRLVGDARLIGRSIHGASEAVAAAGADYLLFGTVFESASKPGVAASGVDALRQAVRASSAPVLAIGGITPERARDCAAAGAAGVAAIGLFLPPGRRPQSLGVTRAIQQIRIAFS